MVFRSKEEKERIKEANERAKRKKERMELIKEYNNARHIIITAKPIKKKKYIRCSSGITYLSD